MTLGERRNHAIINGSRRKRIARGSGTSVEAVNRVLKQFIEMRKMLKTMTAAGGGRKGRQRLMSMMKGRR
jgi:signal recognition particle subunit SRP54